ncbi:MAG: ABC transporter permease [Acidobacteria bacterium]|nr:ABC transporter permease [Acidobacteriota bacterium]
MTSRWRPRRTSAAGWILRKRAGPPGCGWAGWTRRRKRGGTSAGCPRSSRWSRISATPRALLRSPVYSVVAVLSLALGIGANTAMFTLIHALVLRPPPYPEPERLVNLWSTATWQGSSSWGSVSVPDLRDWREQNDVFEEMAAFQAGGVNLTREGASVRLLAAHVEAGVFRVLKVQPLLGRVILPEENTAGRDRVVVLGHGLWETTFGADPRIVGQQVWINGASHVVVGVMPRGFRFPPRSGIEAWTPLTLEEAWQKERGSRFLNVIARLKPGISQTTAQLNLNAISDRLRRLYPEDNATRGASVRSFHLETVAATARLLLVLYGAVGLILLLACANVAHLVLGRAAARARELSVRVALGAGRLRVVRLLLTESLLLAAAGGAAGFFASRWSLAALLRLAGEHLPAGEPIEVNNAVLAYCILVSLAAGLLAGLWPALRASRVELQSALKDVDPTAGTALRRRRGRLMVIEIALSLVLVLGAALLLQSLRSLTRFDLGFRPERVLTMKVALPDTRYSRPGETEAFYDTLLERVRALPGVNHAGVITLLPIQSAYCNSNFSIQGRELPPPGHEPAAEFRLISPDYFRVMGIPLIAGRHFRPEDRAGGRRVALINQRIAEKYFPGEDPVGKQIAIGTQPKPDSWMTIVGVVGNVRDAGVYRQGLNVLYQPFSQSDGGWKTVSLVLRASVEPETLSQAVRREVAGLDRDAAVFLVKTMEQVVYDSTTGTRLLSRLLTLFSGLALVLALIGVYGVMSCLVTQRTHEFGVRMALGAARGGILRLVLRDGLRQGLKGALLGISCAVGMSQPLGRYVIGMSPLHVATCLGAVALVLGVALAASLLAARRASRVDPLSALRHE